MSLYLSTWNLVYVTLNVATILETFYTGVANSAFTQILHPLIFPKLPEEFPQSSLIMTLSGLLAATGAVE